MKADSKRFLRFIIIFAAVFAGLYFGIKILEGLAVPGGNYSPFVDKYLDIASWIRSSLIVSVKFIMSLEGYETYRPNEYLLTVVNGKGISIVYSCLGFGVMSFWAAFALAAEGTKKSRLIWLLIGLGSLWLLNVLRIALVMIAANKGWRFPFGWDHHTWFNIIAYAFIFIMIYFHEKQRGKQ